MFSVTRQQRLGSAVSVLSTFPKPLNNIVACGDQNGTITFWDFVENSLLCTISAHTSGVQAIVCEEKVYENDGDVYFWTQGRDGTCSRWVLPYSAANTSIILNSRSVDDMWDSVLDDSVPRRTSIEEPRRVKSLVLGSASFCPMKVFWNNTYMIGAGMIGDEVVIWDVAKEEIISQVFIEEADCVEASKKLWKSRMEALAELGGSEASVSDFWSKSGMLSGISPIDSLIWLVDSEELEEIKVDEGCFESEGEGISWKDADSIGDLLKRGKKPKLDNERFRVTHKKISFPVLLGTYEGGTVFLFSPPVFRGSRSPACVHASLPICRDPILALAVEGTTFAVGTAGQTALIGTVSGPTSNNSMSGFLLSVLRRVGLTSPGCSAVSLSSTSAVFGCFDGTILRVKFDHNDLHSDMERKSEVVSVSAYSSPVFAVSSVLESVVFGDKLGHLFSFD